MVLRPCQLASWAERAASETPERRFPGGEEYKGADPGLCNLDSVCNNGSGREQAEGLGSLLPTKPAGAFTSVQ